MSNDVTEILKKSIERHRRELIQHYFTMDIDHFEETVKTQLTAVVQTVKTAIPTDYADKFMKEIEQMTLDADVKDSHIKTIEVKHQNYINDIFDDIFDDFFFSFFEDFELFEMEPITDSINDFLLDSTITDDYVEEIETTSYHISENVDQYLEQFSRQDSENMNAQNQDIDMN